MALSRSSIQKHAGVLDTKVVHVPKWRDENGDDTVIVREMTQREVELYAAGASKDKQGQAVAHLLTRVIVDDTGGRLLEDSDASWVAELGFKELNRLMEAVNELSGIGDDEARQAEIDADIAGESEAQSSN